MNQWKGFKTGKWMDEINVRNFIQLNWTPYEGDSSFLEGPTSKTNQLWDKCLELLEQERKNGGVLDVDTKTVSTITSHAPGYIDEALETVVGLQTDAPLRRSVQPSAVFAWQKMLVQLMDLLSTLKWKESSLIIAKLTIKEFSMSILLK